MRNVARWLVLGVVLAVVVVGCSRKKGGYFGPTPEVATQAHH